MNAAATSPTAIAHWIGGRIAAGQSGRSQDVFNPATGAVTGKVALGCVDDVNAAVAAALLDLEFAGQLTRHPGHRVSLGVSC